VKLKKIFRATIRSGATLAVGVAVAIGLPLSASAQQVRANWSKDAPFAQYKTYEWVDSEATNHPFYRQYVGEYVNYALTKKKGLRQVSGSQNPDLYVTYHFTTHETTDLDTYGYGFGGGWGGWGWGGMGMGGMSYSQTRADTRVIGYLTLDMIDAHTRKIVWRGEAVQDDVTKSGNAEEKQVAHSVYKMIDRYPPKMKHD
jgi:hypothetical protein